MRERRRGVAWRLRRERDSGGRGGCYTQEAGPTPPCIC